MSARAIVRALVVAALFRGVVGAAIAGGPPTIVLNTIGSTNFLSKRGLLYSCL
jgi:hypothetical protein